MGTSMRRAFGPALVALFVGLTASSVALGQSSAKGGPSPSPAGAAVYFIGLEDGATIAPKTTIHFGLRGMGIAPAGEDKANSGHHHLLIDTDLPPLDEPIPNDFNHMHFGGGQTEVDLELSPGPHTLQLLLGDKNHIPHSPPVMSARIHVTVAEAAPPPAPAQVAQPQPDTGRQPSSPGAKVYIISPADGANVPLTLTVRFGLTNMSVAPAGAEKANSGHHHLLIDTLLPPFDEPIPSDDNHLHFGAGETEGTITLTPGQHTLQLLMGDANHLPHDPPVFSQPITVTAGVVVQSESPPRKAAQKPALHKEVARQPRRRRAPRSAPDEQQAPGPGAATPPADPGFNDLRSCPAGTHSQSFPTASGFRCVPN
jgi:hypothetical protein